MDHPAARTPIVAAAAYEELASLRSHSWLGAVLAASAMLLLSCTRATPSRSPEEETMEKAAVPIVESSRMQTDVSGTGKPLVLIGGGLTGWASWEPHAARLSGTYRVVRLQLVSVQYGLEDRPLPDEYSVKAESRALAAALDALDLHDPLDLVAWSFGALVTLDFALDRPDRVRTLALIEPPALWVLPDHGRGDAEVREQERLFRGFTGEITEADLEAFVCGLALCPPGRAPRELPQWSTWMQHRRSLRNARAVFDHVDDPMRLRTFEYPVLLVTGTGTAPFLRRIHDALAKALPCARATEMPAGHAPQIVSMDRFLQELTAFQSSGDRG
jgi:pimeloyl-ACP methyl ester carboxylesterase